MDISIVIPSRGREDMLRSLLGALEAQQEGPAFEVIVVEDEKERRYHLPECSFPLLHLAGGGRGPAHARNEGVRNARGRWILFLDDDVIPADRDFLIRLHHVIQRLQESAGILGRVDWHPEVPLNAFRWWLDHGGPQFAFHRLKPGTRVPGRYVSTACFALPRDVAEQHPFDTSFPYPAYEDWDLGIRLEQAGIPIWYREDLRVLHRNAPVLSRYLQRAWRVGWSRSRLVRKHPEIRTLIERLPGGVTAGWVVFQVLGTLLLPLARRVEHLPSTSTPRVGWVFEAVYRKAFFEGYVRGRRTPPP